MKRKVLSEEELKELVLPGEGQLLGIVVKMLGFDRLVVRCTDGKERLCRISGKLKRRVWIREGDVVLVSPWEFQSDKRGDVVWRYTANQVDWLKKNGYLKM
ncbi:MAG: translation initiation factor eIF-1A [Candidatus Hecatellales archaeon]|nr:MAG: translation initiation factor eIF-1A [Candidatus Hecatellales archaeon]